MPAPLQVQLTSSGWVEVKPQEGCPFFLLSLAAGMSWHCCGTKDIRGKITASWYKSQSQITPELVSFVAKQHVECSIPSLLRTVLKKPFIPRLRRGISSAYMGLVASASLRGISPTAFRGLRSHFLFSDSFFWHRVSNQEDLPHRQFFLLMIKGINFSPLDMHKNMED